ncbi:hypothetical protein ACFXTH_028038 [Malus domestica]
MATGLDFCQDLPNPRLPTIKISAPHPRPQPSASHSDSDVVSECAETKSPRFLNVPAILTCPPAPRKPPRRLVSSCKRKLQFFEITNREEVEDMFRSSFLINSQAKRSCPCT